MKTSLATLLTLALCATRLVGQERLPVPPPEPDMLMASTVAYDVEYVDFLKEFVIGGTVVGMFATSFVCFGKEKRKRTKARGNKKGVCQESAMHTVVLGGVVGALGGYFVWLLAHDFEFDSRWLAPTPPPRADVVRFRLPIG